MKILFQILQTRALTGMIFYWKGRLATNHVFEFWRVRAKKWRDKNLAKNNGYHQIPLEVIQGDNLFMQTS